MTNREQLLQELEKAPDELINSVLEFVHREKQKCEAHPLAKFIGIISDEEAEEMLRVISSDCRQVDLNEW